MFVTENFWSQSGPCLLPKISGVEVTPSVTSVESSEQFWLKIRQIWRVCEPCVHVIVKKQIDNNFQGLYSH